MSLTPVNEKHLIVYRELCKLLDTHAAGLTDRELLAVAANLTGKIYALSDIPRSEAIKIMSDNIAFAEAELAPLTEAPQRVKQ